ncbi:MAG: XRE family transcriptional regulator [Xanthomonadales bacterium]|nr:XRE family transcriptional regulator [Xanthomonadales bacterium]MDL1869083.1 helix-turn-helix transcriptional regulator [Gammaproteobacteria bacterium PRO6]
MSLQSSPALGLFAQNFKRARKRAGLSQEDVHKLCGVAASYVSAVERAKRSVTIGCAERLAGAVNVPLSVLLTP